MYHIQETTDGWERSIHLVPPKTLIKSVMRPEILRTAKLLRPDCITLLRHWFDDKQVYDHAPYATKLARAADVLDDFLDGTFYTNYAQYIDIIGLANEVWAESQTRAEKMDRVEQDRAYIEVFNRDHAPQFRARGIPVPKLALSSAAVGNHMPKELAQLAIQTGNYLQYHPYTYWSKVNGEYKRAPNDWKDLSGRWERMEIEWGLKPVWVMDEGGPFESAITGWRHDICLGNSIPRYVEAVRQYIKDCQQTAAYREGRIIGPVALFTTGRSDNTWQYFWTEQPELDELAKMIKFEWKPGTYVPPPDDPPSDPPDNPSPSGEWEVKYQYMFNFYNDNPQQPDWIDHGNIQVPRNWTYREWLGDNPYGDGSQHNVFVPAEGVHLWGVLLPPEEWDEFLNGEPSYYTNNPEPGGFGYHLFSAGAWRNRYTLPMLHVTEGKAYRIRIWFYGDWCRIVNGVKTTAGLEPDHARIELSIDGVGLDEFHNINMLGDNMISLEWVSDVTGFVPVTFGFLTRFANFPNPNGAFIKGVWVEELDDSCQFPIETRIQLLHPQVMSPGQRAQVYNWLENGIPGSLLDRPGTVKVGAYGWSHTDFILMIRDAIRAGKTDSMFVVVDGHMIGTGLDEEWMDDNCPLVAQNTKFLKTARFSRWPTTSKNISQRFGQNPQKYAQFGLPGHAGVDITGSLNDPVYAVLDGMVMESAFDADFGNYVKVRTSINTITYEMIYAHLSQRLVSAGQVIAAGSQIGKMGSTGNSTGVHLHIEMRRPGLTFKQPNGVAWPRNITDISPFLADLEPGLF